MSRPSRDFFGADRSAVNVDDCARSSGRCRDDATCRDERLEQRAHDIRRQTLARVARREFDIGLPDVASHPDATSRRRRVGHHVITLISRFPSTVPTHLVTIDHARVRGGVTVNSACARACRGLRAPGFPRRRRDVDWFLLQLMAAKHSPMAIDNIGGTDPLGLNMRQDSPSVLDVARLAVTIICSACVLCIKALRG